MSPVRQTDAKPNAGEPERFSVRGLAQTFRDGHRLDRHTHSWGQLVYAASGVMKVSTPQATWLVPPTRAIWASISCLVMI